MAPGLGRGPGKAGARGFPHSPRPGAWRGAWRVGGGGELPWGPAATLGGKGDPRRVLRSRGRVGPRELGRLSAGVTRTMATRFRLRTDVGLTATRVVSSPGFKLMNAIVTVTTACPCGKRTHKQLCGVRAAPIPGGTAAGLALLPDPRLTGTVALTSRPPCLAKEW